MEVVYLGIISKIFNAIFKAILSPVFKFLSSLLETVLGWLFDKVLKPLLVNVLEPLFQSLLELVLEILASIIYSIYAECLKLVDAMQEAFHVFAGIKKVTYGNSVEYSLLEALFRMDQVQTGIIGIMQISFCLMFLFAIVGTVRSVLDLDGENNRPISRVLSSTMKCFFKMMSIPLACLFAIVLSGHILTALNSALNKDDASLARMVFVVSSLDACKKAEYNISGKVKDSDTPVPPDNSIQIGTGDAIRSPYYIGVEKKDKNGNAVIGDDGKPVVELKSYSDKAQVEKDFNLARFDYLIGFGGALFLIIILAICLMSFVTRIFEVLILFIVSPFFASVMPLDDGEKFKAWQDMFVAKLFSGYGTVAAMELYMMICPNVMDGKIVFGQGSTEANYLVRLIFLLGGAWATIKCGPSITQLLNYQAGMAERETSASTAGALMGTASMAGAAAITMTNKVSQSYQGWRAGKNAALEKSNERIAKRLQTGTGTAAAGSDSAAATALREGTGTRTAAGGASSGGSSINAGAGGSAGSEAFTGSASSGRSRITGESGLTGGSGLTGSSRSAGGHGSAGGGGATGTDASAENGRPTGSHLPAGSDRPTEGGEPNESQAYTGIRMAGGEEESAALQEGTGVTTDSAEGGSLPSVSAGPAEEGSRPAESAGPAEEGSRPAESAGPAEEGSRPVESTGPAEQGRTEPSGSHAPAAGKAVTGSSSGQARRVGTMLGGKITLNTDRKGSEYVGVNLGKALSFGRDEKGRFQFKMLGTGYRENANGETDKASFLSILNWKKDSSSGKWRLSKVNLGLVRIKRAETVTRGEDGKEVRTFGNLYFSDLTTGAFNLKKRYDQDTGKVETLDSSVFSFGVHYRKNADNQYVMTHTDGLGVRKEYERMSDGSYRKAARVGNFTESSYSYDSEGNRRTDSLSGIKSRQENGGSKGRQIYRRDADEGEQ